SAAGRLGQDHWPQQRARRGALGRLEHAARPRLRVRATLGGAWRAAAGRQSRILRAGRQRPQPREFHELCGDDDVEAFRTADRRVAGAAGAGWDAVAVLVKSQIPNPNVVQTTEARRTRSKENYLRALRVSVVRTLRGSGSLNIQIHRVQRLARAHEEPVPLRP